ncbi:MAG: 1-(5-phosphoribosyl)-5-[(5-phosphoribosylamino)methylideneamino]imidazole-4-carboxamide isomerase [Nitrospirae bacterium]|nr:1-(5-phosphoribosyl)-5-[(5-phosphoribosylamino)methylideneamino]imidazole-4-carboxamide isomerase [Candidatus Manganitrophaceae bacterium]
MILIPAIDMKGGRCVRLVKGDLDNETVYSDDPVKMAQRWVNEGGERLHLVDLDGAVAGKAIHFSIIEKIVQSVSIPVQIGGGIRTLDQIEHYLKIGIASVILGTVALKNSALLKEACEKFPGKIIVGLDSRKGKVAIQGWVEECDETVTEMAIKMESIGVAALILTDIEKDGMLQGPNFKLMEEVGQAVKIPLVASGGVTTLAQIEKLTTIPGVKSAIIGKALYEGRIVLSEAIAATKGQT